MTGLGGEGEERLARGQIRSGEGRMVEEEDEGMEQDDLFSRGSVSDMLALQGAVGTRQGEAEPPVPILILASSLIHSYRSGSAYPSARTLIHLLRITSLISTERLDGLISQGRTLPDSVNIESSKGRFVSAVATWVTIKNLDLLEGVEEEIQEKEEEWIRSRAKRPRIATPEPLGLLDAPGREEQETAFPGVQLSLMRMGGESDPTPDTSQGILTLSAPPSIPHPTLAQLSIPGCHNHPLPFSPSPTYTTNLHFLTTPLRIAPGSPPESYSTLPPEISTASCFPAGCFQTS